MKVTIMKVMVMAAKHGGREEDGCDENDSDIKEDDGDDVNMMARKP